MDTKLRNMLELFEQQTGNLNGTMSEYCKWRIDLYNLIISAGIPFDALVKIEQFGLPTSNF